MRSIYILYTVSLGISYKNVPVYCILYECVCACARARACGYSMCNFCTELPLPLPQLQELQEPGRGSLTTRASNILQVTSHDDYAFHDCYIHDQYNTRSFHYMKQIGFKSPQPRWCLSYHFPVLHRIGSLAALPPCVLLASNVMGEVLSTKLGTNTQILANLQHLVLQGSVQSSKIGSPLDLNRLFCIQGNWPCLPFQVTEGPSTITARGWQVIIVPHHRKNIHMLSAFPIQK